MNVLNEKLQFLLQKYSVESDIVLQDKDTVRVGGKTLPLLAHRSERRFTELKNLANGGTLVGISVMRVARIVERGQDVYAQLYRELDICQYLLQRKIAHITVMENGNVLNAITTTTDDVVCTLEIAATLKAGERAKDKHEIIAQRGTACDIVVDAQLKQNSIYLFGDNDQAYTDVDFELYGLSEEDIAVVRAAFNLAKQNNLAEVEAIHANLCALVDAAKRSAISGQREVL